jgi:hypothetical protein
MSQGRNFGRRGVGRLFVLMGVLLVIACEFPGGNPEAAHGGFNGRTSGCADFLVAVEHEDGYRILDFRATMAHFRDTQYVVNLAESSEIDVRIDRYDRRGVLSEVHCNDAIGFPEPVVRTSNGLVPGWLTLSIHRMKVEKNT